MVGVMILSSVSQNCSNLGDIVRAKFCFSLVLSSISSFVLRENQKSSYILYLYVFQDLKNTLFQLVSSFLLCMHRYCRRYTQNESHAGQGTTHHFLCTVVSGQINPDWDSLQANQISTSSKTDKL
jgi:hypothetical protein